ncbi:MAG: helix-turn-helix transcriptional regulator [Dehalococcoidia bacterium]|nr:helix-turn-helix transcriptional regulator [Dehalococcoidia bacterium]
MGKRKASKKNADGGGANGAAAAGVPPAPGSGQPQPRLTGDLLTSSLLAFLRRWNAYGYQLVQSLKEAGLLGFDSTTVYRTLRQLERAGMVSSFWDTSESGPARRMYSLTKAGETFLDLWVDLFGRYQKILHSALDSLDNYRSPENGGSAAGERNSSPRQASAEARRRGRDA